MQVDTTKMLNRDVLQHDINTLQAVGLLTGFSSPNTALSLVNINATLASRADKEKAHVSAQAQEKNARDAYVAAQWAVHNLAIQLRGAVIAQWGPDSEQYQTIGGKKKSERRRPARKEETPSPEVRIAS